MRSWIRPITDRNQLDLTRRTAKAFLNVADLNRIESNLAYLSERLNNLGYKVMPVKVENWNKTKVPRVVNIQNICNSVIDITRAYYNPDEYTDISRIPNSPLHFSHINSIEQILADLHRLSANMRDTTNLGWAMGIAHTGLHSSI